MESLMRNLKYWAWYYVKTDALTTLMIVGIVVLYAFADGGDFLETFLTMLPLYLGMMLVMEVIVFGFTSITVLFPMAVGLGAKRSSCIAAKAMFEHVVFIINAAMVLIGLAYSQPAIRDYIIVAIPLMIALMGLLMTAGNLVSLFSNKFGRTAGMIIYIVFVAVISVGGMLFVMSDAAVTLAMTMMYTLFAFSVVVAVVCLGLDALSAYWLYLSVKNKDLNFSV